MHKKKSYLINFISDIDENKGTMTDDWWTCVLSQAPGSKLLIELYQAWEHREYIKQVEQVEQIKYWE